MAQLFKQEIHLRSLEVSQMASALRYDKVCDNPSFVSLLISLASHLTLGDSKERNEVYPPRPPLNASWFSDSAINVNDSGGLLEKFGRRYAVAGASHSKSSNTIPQNHNDLNTAEAPAHSAHPPVYRTSSELDVRGQSDAVEHGKKPRGAQRLRGLFHKTSAGRHEAAATTAAHLGLHLDHRGTQLSYLPSEAQKIATPPASAEPKLNPFDALSRSVSSSARSGSPLGKTDIANHTDTFRAKWALAEDASSPTKASVKVNAIPEHFPSSPLCPRNPKHKSGGTGTCPYHK